MAWVWGLASVRGLAWVWGLAKVLTGVEVAGSILIPKSISSLGWRVTISLAGISGVIGFLV